MKTRNGTLHPLMFLILICAVVGSAAGQQLKVATVNCWSGLDYYGSLTVGEYESSARREERFAALLSELRRTSPDVLALQEVNPAGSFAERLADSLGYDCLSQRVNAGVKGGSIGIPWNLNEGLALLARKELKLRLFDVWELSESFGLFGNGVSFHMAEKNIALVGRLHIQNRSFLVVNTHLTASVPNDSSSQKLLENILTEGRAGTVEKKRAFEQLSSGSQLRQRQIQRLLERLSMLPEPAPWLLLGDFNAPPSSPDIQLLKSEGHALDVMEIAGKNDVPTWDPKENSNIRFAQQTAMNRSSRVDAYDKLEPMYDNLQRRIDYIFISPAFSRQDICSADRFLDRPQGDLYASDHYGILADVNLSRALNSSPVHSDSVLFNAESEIEPLPILSYDTDVGLGYGAKAFFLNQLGMNESFDVVLFNSTKGERWYRLVFSLPDFERRQGKIYPWAVDVTLDYDKWITNSFFGIGNASSFETREYYTREPFELSVSLSRGLSPTSVAQVGMKYKWIGNSHFSDTSRLRLLLPALNSTAVEYTSAVVNYRYDSRNSFVNPSSGMVLQGEAEVAPQWSFSNAAFTRLSGIAQYYSILCYPKTIFAARLSASALIGDDLPVQTLLSVGGNQTLRGSPQDRYLDNASIVGNAELRFPLFWRLGGVVGFDAGKVWRSLQDIDFYRWAWNPVAGLRLYMDTFVVRADVGFGNETTGFYLNFGQLF